jgi:hypothetical protein
MVTFLNNESLTTKLTLIIVGLTAGSGLLIPATYASFHPVTSGEIADNTIRSADIANGQVTTADIGAEQVRSGDIGAGQVTSNKISDIDGVNSVDIVDGQVGSADIGDGEITGADIDEDAIDPFLQIVRNQGTVPGSGNVVLRADCPEGMDVTGGGFTGPPFVNVWSSSPFDSNTWEVSAVNEAGADATLVAHAVCLAPMP